VDAGLILGLTLAVLGVLIVVLGTIAALVLGPAVRRALAERRDAVDAALASAEPDGGSGDSAEPDGGSGEGAEHGDGGRR